ncbi:MAG: glycine betaine ABC transporter substrate-binding protein [Chloroflexota bacterium]
MLALIAIFILAGCGEAEAIEEKIKIVIVQNNWGSSQVNAEVAKQLMESELGYEVELVNLDENAQWSEISQGDAHISLEIWPSGHRDNISEFIEKQRTVAYAGLLGPVGRIGWFVPDYVLETYPQVATWEGLMDPEVADYFATAETGDKGQILGPGRLDRTHEEAIISNLDLPFEVIYAESETGILAGVEAAIDREGPILFYLWTPHVIHAEHELTEIQLPEYYPGCHDVPAAVDCAYPDELLFKIVWGELAVEAPEIYTFIRNMELTLDDQIGMLAEIKEDEITPTKAAEHWIKANEDVWKNWLP